MRGRDKLLDTPVRKPLKCPVRKEGGVGISKFGESVSPYLKTARRQNDFATHEAAQC